MHNSNEKQIAGAILIVGVLIAGAILLKDARPQVANAPSANAPSANAPSGNNIGAISQGRPVSSTDHITGNLNAKIVVVEYSDLECPFCKVFDATMKQVTQNNNDVAWVYRHYPIAQLHSKAFKESEATECAWDQGGNDAFWKYTDRLFAVTPSNNGLDAAELPKIAEYVGLNVATFNTCLSSGKFTSKVQADFDDGVKAGANGTPSSMIITKKDISTSTQNEILTALNAPGAISFSSNNKKIMSMNGALPIDMVNKILAVLLK
ncbi:MAG: DsbA family protein [bacterium]